MTTVDLKPTKIRIDGHCNHDEIGKDIVCAAISTLSEATYNYLLATGNKVSYIDCEGLYIIKMQSLNAQGEAIINSFKKMVDELIKDYPGNIRWRKK